MHVLNQGMEILSPENPIQLQGWSCLQFPVYHRPLPSTFLFPPQIPQYMKNNLESSDLREMCKHISIHGFITMMGCFYIL